MDKKTTQHSEGEARRCTNCGGALEGYTISSKGLWWDTRKRTSIIGARGTTLPSIICLENVPAWKCSKCRLIMFNYRTSFEFLKKCVHCHAEIPLSAEKCEACGTKQRSH